MGAPRLHVVDLDGAAQGELRHLDTIKELAQAMLVPIQVGGGIRHLEAIEQLLKAGVERVVLGTAAVQDPKLVEEACHRFPDAIVVSIDTREGWVATHGWQQETRLSSLEFAKSMAKLGVRRFIYTDISRDGTLTEPNFAAVFELLTEIRLPVIASGGISSLNHLKMLQKLGVEGAIVGKALYTGDINLKQAIAAMSEM